MSDALSLKKFVDEHISEIDVEDMVFHASEDFVYNTDTNNAYRQGIKDILKLISNDKRKD